MFNINFGLEKIVEFSKFVDDNFIVIGSSALYLLGIKIKQPADIDIFTGIETVEKFRIFWSKNLVDFQPEKEKLFRSNFAKFKFKGTIIEVMGGLQLKKENCWQNIYIADYQTVEIENTAIKIPTLNEQKRLLNLFGRPKDLELLRLLEQIQ